MAVVSKKKLGSLSGPNIEQFHGRGRVPSSHPARPDRIGLGHCRGRLLRTGPGRLCPRGHRGQLFRFYRRCVCGDRTIVHYGDGDEVAVFAPTSPVCFLLISGLPISEPVAWYGPIVMNSQEELQLAFEEYRKGTFIKRGGS